MEMKNLKLDMQIENKNHKINLEIHTAEESNLSAHIRCYRERIDSHTLEKEEQKHVPKRYNSHMKGL